MKKFKVCKRCGRKVKSLSARGLCHQCSLKAITKNIKSLREHKGKSYQRWREGMVMFVNKLSNEG